MDEASIAPKEAPSSRMLFGPLFALGEGIARIAVIWVAISYGVGLLVVNLRLARYGVFTAGLVRSEFILVGSMWLLLLCLYYVLLRFAVDNVRKAVRLWRAKERVRSIAHVLSGITGTLIVGTMPIGLWTGVYPLSFSDWRAWFTFIVLLGTPFAFWRVWKTWKLSWSTWQEDSDPAARFALLPVNQILNDALFAFVAVALYAGLVYPQISAALGGGKPVPVRLALPSDASDLLRSIRPLKTTREGPIYELIAETDDWLLIASPEPMGRSPWTPPTGSRAVRIPRGLVKAVFSGDLEESPDAAKSRAAAPPKA